MTKNKYNELRFGVTDSNGHRSATWSVINSKLKSDIYISCRELGGKIKTSLHQSGSWHVGFSKDATKNCFDNEDTKYIEIWKRPQPINEGVTLALRIVTPFSAVTTPIEKSSKEIVWIPNCKEGFATEIDLIITSDDTIVSHWPGKNSGANLVGTFKLANKETVWIVYWIVSLPDLSGLNGKKFSFLNGKDRKDLMEGNFRVVIFGQGDDGSRTIFDCAVQSKGEIKNDNRDSD